eukprot:2565869-Amphidinium_carterae.1
MKCRLTGHWTRLAKTTQTAHMSLKLQSLILRIVGYNKLALELEVTKPTFRSSTLLVRCWRQVQRNHILHRCSPQKARLSTVQVTQRNFTSLVHVAKQARKNTHR